MKGLQNKQCHHTARLLCHICDGKNLSHRSGASAVASSGRGNRSPGGWLPLRRAVGGAAAGKGGDGDGGGGGKPVAVGTGGGDGGTEPHSPRCDSAAD